MLLQSLLLAPLLANAYSVGELVRSANVSAKETAPGQLFDLKDKWFLEHEVGGKMKTSKSSEMDTYIVDDNFYVDGDAVVFRVRDDAVSGSASPRTEIRVKGTFSESNTHTLKGEVAIKHVTSKHDKAVIWSQIHTDGSDERAMILKLYWYEKDDGYLEAQVKEKDDGDYVPKHYHLGNVAKGEKFTFESEFKDGKVTVKINGSTKVDAYHAPIKSGDGIYFKAGSYNQCGGDECNSSSGYAEVRYYALDYA